MENGFTKQVTRWRDKCVILNDSEMMMNANGEMTGHYNLLIIYTLPNDELGDESTPHTM